MKYLLILLLISSIAISQEVNYYQQNLICQESKREAIIGMGLMAATFIIQHQIKLVRNKNTVVCIGLTLNIANVALFERRKYNIKNRFRLIKN